VPVCQPGPRHSPSFCGSSGRPGGDPVQVFRRESRASADPYGSVVNAMRHSVRDCLDPQEVRSSPMFPRPSSQSPASSNSCTNTRASLESLRAEARATAPSAVPLRTGSGSAVRIAPSLRIGFSHCDYYPLDSSREPTGIPDTQCSSRARSGSVFSDTADNSVRGWRPACRSHGCLCLSQAPASGSVDANDIITAASESARLPNHGSHGPAQAPLRVNARQETTTRRALPPA